MLHQVYELKLPKFSEIVNVNFPGFPEEKNYEYLTGFDLKSILKKEWLDFLDIKWDSYRYFRKSSFSGSLHTDLNLAEDDIYNKYNICVWGINWVFGGSGKIDFWNFESVKRIGMTPGSENLPSLGVVPKYVELKPADYSYNNLENKVYLVNASLPHRAHGGKGRSVFSLRPCDVKTPWNEIVKKFESYII